MFRGRCWEQYGEQRTEPSAEISSEVSSVPQWKRVKGEVNLHPCFRKHATNPPSLSRLLQAGTSPKHGG